MFFLPGGPNIKIARIIGQKGSHWVENTGYRRAGNIYMFQHGWTLNCVFWVITRNIFGWGRLYLLKEFL